MEAETTILQQLQQKRTFKATAIGIAAILFWAGLALLTVTARGIPPFELLALSFGVAFLAGVIVLAARGRQALVRLRQPPGPWLTAFAAIFLYHALYFYALTTVPPAEAGLIAYLWPLLIVLFAAVGPGGERLRLNHLGGAILGLLGTAVLFVDHPPETFVSGAAAGYTAAFGCAVIWSGYSVVNRHFANVPSEMLIGVCGAVTITDETERAQFSAVWSPHNRSPALKNLLDLAAATGRSA
ncbi:DMT family transporter [Ancylobacter lacus]|uniref:DMT family transporter n=1 Tax=Ancylobacter lacus TaxID=2579970 RepID=UPI001BD1B890|nr:EamA family transporter [Ancylobacter lacus]MBS7538213.1 EamA family transporter [Ancylobacter lacus]